MTTRPRVRQTAEERRETLLAAAIAEFGRLGYHGTPTEAIAKRAGISHAYLFRLYGTKKDLFVACIERCFDRTAQTFRDAVAAKEPGERPLAAMGRAYVEMLSDRELLLLQLQTYAAAADDELRDVTRRRYRELRAEIAALAGEPELDVLKFMSQGMLINNVAALDLDPQDWLWLADDREEQP